MTHSSSDSMEASNLSVPTLFLWALLGTIGMLFMALISAYLVRRSGSDWQAINLPMVLWLNILFFIPGTYFMHQARKHPSQSRLMGAAIMGVLFLIGQLYGWSIWSARGIFLKTNPYSAFFYLFSGVHGVHVLAGIIWLIVLAVKPSVRSVVIDCASDYWLFLAGVWMAILLVLTFL